MLITWLGCEQRHSLCVSRAYGDNEISQIMKSLSGRWFLLKMYLFQDTNKYREYRFVPQVQSGILVYVLLSRAMCGAYYKNLKIRYCIN